MSEEEKDIVEGIKENPTSRELMLIHIIERLDEENTELKEDNSHQWKERCRLTFELGKLQKENEELKEVNKKLKEKLHEKNMRIIKLNKLLGE